MNLAGHIWDKETQDWSLLSERVKGYASVNGQLQEKEIYIPIRDYNFQYALHKSDGDVAKALDYVEEHLMKNGKPVYLPGVLMEKALNPDPRSYTYGRILREIDENKLTK